MNKKAVKKVKSPITRKQSAKVVSRKKVLKKVMVTQKKKKPYT